MTHKKTKPSTLLSIIARLGVLLIVIACAVGRARAGDDGGSALDFDGSNDYVHVCTNCSSYGSNTITYEAWVNPRIASGARGIVLRGNLVNSLGVAFGVLSNQVWVGGNAGGGWNNSFVGSVPNNRWTHIAATYDQGSGDISVYINGVFLVTVNHAFLINGPNYNTRIGSNHGSPVQLFNGQMDDIRVWNDIRTPAEIQANMFKELTGSEPSLVAYWKFNDGVGITATDSAGYSDGTLTNMDPGTDWVNSTAPIGNITVAGRTQIAGIWAADTSADSNVLTIANNTFLQDVGDDIIFGHDGSDATPNGTTTADLGSSAAIQRWTWTWYLDKTDLGTTGGTVTFTFDEGGSPTAAGNYRLLYRSGTSGNFTDIATATGISSVIFSGVNVNNINNGYYTLGTVNTSEDPLLINLASFSATAGEDGVLVAWTTASEVDNAGFNVWRADSAGGEYVKLNGALIPAQGGPTQGAAYSFLDAGSDGGYYKLEDVDTGGVNTFHGPVAAEGGDPTAVGLASFAASTPMALLVIPLLALGAGGLALLRRRRCL